MLYGHLAVSALEHRYLKAEWVPVMVAGIFPDVIDKTACQILHLVPNGRMWGHTLVGMAVSTLIVGAIWGRRTMASWALGYISHLVGDTGGFVPWFHPFVRYDFKPSPTLWENLIRFFTDPLKVGFETALSLWAIVALWRPWTKKQQLPDKHLA